MPDHKFFNRYGCLHADSQLFAARLADLFGMDPGAGGVGENTFGVIGGDNIAGLIFAEQPTV